MYLVDFRILKQIIILILLAVIPLAVAVIGALITDAEGGLIILSVEMLSSRSIMVLERTAGLLPLGIAFAAGMVATVNPCGFPMLPTYLLMYLGSGDDNRIGGSIGKRLWNALIVGTVVSSGFTVLFGLAGLIIGAGVYILVDAMPWIGLAVGTLLTLVGSWLLVGGKLYSMTALKLADRIRDKPQINVRGYFIYGLAYATASLSCALPIFMAVTGVSLATANPIQTVEKFILYALGMGFVIVVMTMALSMFKSSIVIWLKKFIPYTYPVSALFMILAGSYIVFYWLTWGGLLKNLS